MAHVNDSARNKKKKKLREKKKHPYKSGGRFRATSVKEGGRKSSSNKK